MKFTAKGYISAKNGKNTVEVEGVKYWISGQDMQRIVNAIGTNSQDRRFDEIPELEGKEVNVTVHRDENGCWAELANQNNWCPNVI